MSRMKIENLQKYLKDNIKIICIDKNILKIIMDIDNA